MPWTPDEATQHTKQADTPEKRAKWAAVANSALRRQLSEQSAIRMANSAVKGESDA